MSKTELYKVPKKGEIEIYETFSNSWLWAALIWDVMGNHYLDTKYSTAYDKPHERQAVWDLSLSNLVNINDRIVMISTFDNFMVKRKNLPLLIDAMNDFSNRYEPGHLPLMVTSLEYLSKDYNCFSVCWNTTSVNADAWLMETGDYYKDNEPIMQMYDISKSNEHFFLFEEYPELLVVK